MAMMALAFIGMMVVTMSAMVVCVCVFKNAIFVHAVDENVKDRDHVQSCLVSPTTDSHYSWRVFCGSGVWSVSTSPTILNPKTWQTFKLDVKDVDFPQT